MSKLTNDDLFKLFAQAGTIPQRRDGANREELCQLYATDPRAAYVQFLWDRFCKVSADRSVQQVWSDYPLSFDSIRKLISQFEPTQPWRQPLFYQEMGYKPGFYPTSFLARPIESQTLPEKPSKPELSPEAQAVKDAHDRELTRLRVQRFRERQKEQSRLNRAEARHDAISAEEKTRHQAFGQTFAGQITAEASPAALEGKDEPAPEGPSWQ